MFGEICFIFWGDFEIYEYNGKYSKYLKLSEIEDVEDF